MRCAVLWLCSVQRCLQYTLNCNFNLFSMNCTSSFPSSSLSFTHSLLPFALFCCTTWRMRYILRVTYSNIETATCPHALLCNFNVAIAVRHCYCCCCLCYCCCCLCFCCFGCYSTCSCGSDDRPPEILVCIKNLNKIAEKNTSVNGKIGQATQCGSVCGLWHCLYWYTCLTALPSPLYLPLSPCPTPL